MLEQNIKTKGRLLATLVRELLQAETFNTLADLTEALKWRCKRLKIHWTNDDINDAYRLIASNTALVDKGFVKIYREAQSEPEIIPRAAAAQIYREVLRRYRQEHPLPVTVAVSDRPTYFPDLVPV